MKKTIKNIRKRIKDEAGQALIIVLLLLALGSLIMAPLLSYTGTGLKAGQVYDTKTDELYAADAGVEDALWNIKNDKLGEKSFDSGGDYDPFAYYECDPPNEWTYTLSEQVNDKDVAVIIRNMWMPKYINPPTPDDARTIIQGVDEENPAKLIVTGKGDAPQLVGEDYIGQYEIKITFLPAAGEENSLLIQSVGIWLPPGFEYYVDATHKSPFETLGVDYYSVPEITSHNGGTAVVWSFSSYPFAGSAGPPPKSPFPGVSGPGSLERSTIRFYFRAGSALQVPEGVAWVDTTGVTGVPYAWDADVKVFGIYSTATTPETGTSTDIEAYTVKGEMRELVGATSGDYYATGDAFLYPSSTSGDNYKFRDDMYSSGDAEVDSVIVLPPDYDYDPLDGIPDNAAIVYAYLYWTGWIDNDGYDDPGGQLIWGPDTCNLFTYWDRVVTTGSQTRYPSGDITRTGTWSPTTNMYSYVDEEGSNDGDTTYLLHGTSAGYVMFSFPVFSVPAGSTIQSLTIYLVARDDPNGTNKMQPAIRAGSTNYTTSLSGNPSISTEVSPVPPGYSTISYAYTYNPKRGVGQAWTADDINGIGMTYALQGFGVYSADANPQIRLTQVYAVVNYETSCWSLSSGRFQGQGSTSATVDQRTLTLKDSSVTLMPNLSAYVGQTVQVSWDQTKSGTLESTDKLYYAFYNQTTGWSANYVAFSGNSPASSFSINIPDAYLTASFKMRFYFNFDDPTEYVQIDNIKIVLGGYTGLEYHTGVTTPAEVQTLVHDNARVDTVLFGPNANPTQVVYADNYQIVEPVIMNGAVDEGKGTWSYCCFADVTALVTEWIEDEDLGNNGTGTYTVRNAWVGVDNELDPDYSWNFQDGGSTGYPLGTPADTTELKDQNCHSGWSLILIYSSPQSKGHQLYLYDINRPGFKYTQGRGSPASPYDLDFDGDGAPGGIVKGFLVPEPIAGETEAGRATIFVGEGDQGRAGDNWGNDYFSINGVKLWDGITCWNNSSGSPNNAWNSGSRGLVLTESGIDIDTFIVPWNYPVSNPILEPGDVEATIDPTTEYDGIHIIYIILSFRSDIVTGGTMTYLIN